MRNVCLMSTGDTRGRPKLQRNSYFDGWTSMCAYKDVTACYSQWNRPFLQSCAYRTVTFVKVNPYPLVFRSEEKWSFMKSASCIYRAIQFARTMTYDFRQSIKRVLEMSKDRLRYDTSEWQKSLIFSYISRFFNTYIDRHIFYMLFIHCNVHYFLFITHVLLLGFLI